MSGVYSLIEVNGEKLSAVSWTKNKNGERCKAETLEGAMFLDSQGRAAFFSRIGKFARMRTDQKPQPKKRQRYFPGRIKSQATR